MPRKGKSQDAGLQEASAQAQPEQAEVLLEASQEAVESEAAATAPAQAQDHPTYDPSESLEPVGLDDDEDTEVIAPAADPNLLSADPRTSLPATLIGIGRLYNDAAALSDSLSIHLRRVAGEPELHSVLQRFQIAFGDLRHSVASIETSMSDELRDAISQVVA